MSEPSGHPVEPETGEPGLDSRTQFMRQAVKVWTGELVDLGGQNRLLYYRDLKQGTLDLGAENAANGIAVGDLMSSRPTRLSLLFDPTALPPAARRARTIKAKAQENFEERGLQTLFLAWGMATWSNTRGTATPAAPVLLRQANLTGRGGAAEDFDVLLPGEWEINPTLLHLLKTDHDIEVQGGELLALFDDDATPPDPTELFEHLAKSASAIPGFAVLPRVVLGNFSYAKLPMVLDLEVATDALLGSELLCAIAGDDGARDAVRARHPNVAINEPDVIPPADEFLILPADASQSYAINAAVGGADLVIDGPPGTGKSQTIANLIATLAARGRRILFVAEKRAAIDAVLDRLNRVGLGDLVLDLYEGAGSKRKLAEELARTLNSVGSLPRPNMTAAQENLARHRQVLVDRVEALHGRREPWGLSVYDVLAQLPGIPETATSQLRVRGDALTRLTGPAFREARSSLERFIGLGGLNLSPATTPWSGAYAAGTVPTPDAAQAALTAVSTLVDHTLPQAVTRVQAAGLECGLSLPESLGGWGQALTLLDDVETTLARFDSTIFDQPLDRMAAELAPAEKGALGRLGARIANGKYRKARKTAMLLWRGEKSRPSALRAAVSAAADQATLWRRVSVDDGRPRPPTDPSGVRGAYGQLRAEVQSLGTLLGGADLGGLSHVELDTRARALLADTPTLSKLPELTRIAAWLRAAALWPLVNEVTTRNLDVDQAVACLNHVWLMSILETVAVGDQRVGAFDGEAHRRTVSDYRAADGTHIDTTMTRVRRAVAEHATAVRDEYPDESDVIQHQARLKRGHLPVRHLFQAAPHVLGALKPCWAMSPLVVSQLLPAQACFDVVIFDEASQITPADAVGALMRANRAIVAGDPHQLPPTSVFMTSGGGQDDEEAEDAALGNSAGTRNMESVLDAMSALLPPPKGTRTLGWHYRSKDERLIAFSNAQPNLYAGSLTTFPGVAGGKCLSHVLVPFVPGRVGQEDSVADEVAKVVDLILEHARTRPDESLGVIAMGIKHANRVLEALRRSRAQYPELDSFLDGTASAQAQREPFFVKNLERVQGDERDAIILTIGYGKTTDGRLLYHWGPINNEGGERRLNVAITRARALMTVVSSFSSRDMDPNKLRSDGAQMVYGYLQYAESGGTDLGDQAKSKPDLNPFERDIQTRLTAAGIPLVAQYGCSGYWIDYAAQHPTRPGEMVLAIECDGASYHSSATARDRDRLRQEHLERLGWTFHRIWSQDWFFHREAEIERAVKAYQTAVAASDDDDAQSPLVMTAPLASGATAAPTPRAGPCPIATHRESIDDYTGYELVAVVRWLESDTLLRTEDELVAETIRALGFARRGKKITAAIRNAIGLARKPGFVVPTSASTNASRPAYPRPSARQPRR